MATPSPKELLETHSELPFSNKKWTGDCRWTSLFDDSSVWGAFEGLPECVASNGTLSIPSATVHDVQSKHQWKGSDGQDMFSINSRKFRTEHMIIRDFQKYKCIKIHDRFYLSKTVGDIDAADAIANIINRIRKKPTFEIIVNQQTLLQIYRWIMNANSSGGYAACYVGQCANKWYSVKNIIFLGPEKNIIPKPKNENRECEKKMYTSTNTIGASPDGDMFAFYNPEPLTDLLSGTTTPTLWEGQLDSLDPHSPTIPIPCRFHGFSVDLETGQVEMVDKSRDVPIPRPFFGWKCEMIQRPNSKSSVITVKKVTNLSSNPSIVDSKMNLFTILGMELGGVDITREYVRLPPIFRAEFLQALESSEKLRLNFTIPDTRTKHKAGLKGRFSIYYARPYFNLESKWYWLDSLQPLPRTTTSISNLNKMRYLKIK